MRYKIRLADDKASVYTKAKTRSCKPYFSSQSLAVDWLVFPSRESAMQELAARYSDLQLPDGHFEVVPLARLMYEVHYMLPVGLVGTIAYAACKDGALRRPAQLANLRAPGARRYASRAEAISYAESAGLCLESYEIVEVEAHADDND